VLLLLRLLRRLLLLLRLSGRQNARGVLGLLLRVGSPQNLLVDGAGRERTSAAERAMFVAQSTETNWDQKPPYLLALPPRWAATPTSA
jgi:hypothetical protein